MTDDAWRLPRRRDALSYWLRTRLLSLWAQVRETCAPSSPRWPAAAALADAPVIARHRSPLWADGDDAEFVLTAGKVESLRRALRAFDGIEVPAGGVLSFWAQLGRPSARRGFVIGREVREGCVVPTVAGGICQLSNALAAVAAQAGLQFVERHGHTARVGDAADAQTDATVFWRHVDLKLQAGHPWRLDVTMDGTELVVSLRAHVRPVQVPIAVTTVRDARPPARGCLTCNERDCFRHAVHRGLHGQARTAALLDAWSPEFAAHLAGQPGERFAPVPLRLAFWRPQARAWDGVTHRVFWASLRGALWRRLWSRREGGRRQVAIVDAQRWLAQAYAAALTPLHTRLVVDQALLPHLVLRGALAGREVEVLAHALPLADIHARLDAAAQRWPHDESLRDFRAPPDLVAAEARALAGARVVVTPHAEVATVLSQRLGGEIKRLDWMEPPARVMTRADSTRAPLLLFSAPARARKGSLELAAALSGLNCRLRVLGRTDPAAWPGIALETEPSADPLAGVSAVVLPAHVEHAPRLLLRALACGLPVIATPACGLGARPGLMLVAAGDVAGLRAALIATLEMTSGTPDA